MPTPNSAYMFVKGATDVFFSEECSCVISKMTAFYPSSELRRLTGDLYYYSPVYQENQNRPESCSEGDSVLIDEDVDSRQNRNINTCRPLCRDYLVSI